MPPSTHHRISHAYQHDRVHRGINISHLHSSPNRAPPAPAAPRQPHAKSLCASQHIAQRSRAIQIQPTSSPKSSSSMRRATHSTELSAPSHRLAERESMPEPTRQAVRHSTGNHQSTARLIACCAPWGRKVDRAMQHERDATHRTRLAYASRRRPLRRTPPVHAPCRQTYDRNRRAATSRPEAPRAAHSERRRHEGSTSLLLLQCLSLVLATTARLGLRRLRRLRRWGDLAERRSGTRRSDHAPTQALCKLGSAPQDAHSDWHVRFAPLAPLAPMRRSGMKAIWQMAI